MGILAALILLAGVFSGGLVSYLETIAGQLM